MAERVDAGAVDVGDRAGGAEGQVAADQADADGVAGRERRAVTAAPPTTGAWAASAARTGAPSARVNVAAVSPEKPAIV